MSHLKDKLSSDYLATKKELARVEDEQKMLKWKLSYIETLLQSTDAPPKASANDDDDDSLPAPAPFASQRPYAGMTIADIAASVLAAHGQPLACIEIAKRAMDGGFNASNIERARSHFSATISKDMNGPRPRFWQVSRGEIGLIEWKKDEPDEDADGQSFAPFKDDDIPF